MCILRLESSSYTLQSWSADISFMYLTVLNSFRLLWRDLLLTISHLHWSCLAGCRAFLWIFIFIRFLRILWIKFLRKRYLYFLFIEPNLQGFIIWYVVITEKKWHLVCMISLYMLRHYDNKIANFYISTGFF